MNKKKYTKEETIKWFEMYKTNTLLDVSKYFLINKNTIKKYFHIYDLRKGRFSYTKECVLDWYKEYETSRSIYKVAEKFNISISTVSVHFKTLNLKVSGNDASKICENFFAEDTAESFYWAGFIAADGCILERKNSNKKTLRIALATKDICLLENFKQCTKHEGKIRTGIRNGNGFCETTVRNDTIVNDLRRFNVEPRKSLIYSFPEWLINHDLVNHFMRGYFDGDGCFSSTKQKNRIRRTMSFSVCGTKNFVEIFGEILRKQCLLNKTKIIFNKKAGNVYYLAYGGNQNIIKIRNFLYRGAQNKSIFLKRKRDLVFNDWIDNVKRQKKIA